MELRARTRQQLRRAAMTAALGALLVPATAGAATKKKTPTITRVAPRSVAVGETLTVYGKNFIRGRKKNSVLFKRDGGQAVFIKADLSTAKKMTVLLPKTLEKYMVRKDGGPGPTRFHLRVLAAKLSKAYTSGAKAPLIGPEKPKTDGTGGDGTGSTAPDGDCDGDGVKNKNDADDDNDLLSDTFESSLKLDSCNPDSDGDGVEDGYEYASAVDLNNDDYQEPNRSIPYPAKRPYPNPLFPDANVDYDGDGLTLSEEQALWRYTYTVNHTATRSLSPLSYSDGSQHSFVTYENGDGRRIPTMPIASYTPPQAFGAWTGQNGYATILLRQVLGTYAVPVAGHAWVANSLYDFNRDGTVDATELYYWDYDQDGFVSDDERDEDADGLTNWDESVHGRMQPGWWKGCYMQENAYPIEYAGTSPVDADSDGDGILDGADDQDHDDVPNILELDRSLAANHAPQGGCGSSATPGDNTFARRGFVQPFNPCLPDTESRTCESHPAFDKPYPPFDPNYRNYMILQ